MEGGVQRWIRPLGVMAELEVVHLLDVMIVLPFIRNDASLTNRTFYHYSEGN